MASDVSSSVDNDETSGTQYGGYEFEFVKGMGDDLEDMFMCKICHLPSRNAQLSVCCGHTFCKSCLERMKYGRLSTLSYGTIAEWFRTRSASTCPVCRDDQTFDVVPNKQVDRKIRSLHMFCTNKKKGCDWQGELNDKWPS